MTSAVPLARALGGFLLACLVSALPLSCGNEHRGAGGAAPGSGTILTGFARVDVTPSVPVKLAGYGSFFFAESACRWSTGVHDPLFAHAVAFEDREGHTPIVLVLLDAIGLMRADVAVVTEGIASRVGIPERSVVVACTHTHHAPDTVGLWGVIVPPISGRQEDVIEQTLAGAVRAGVEAWEARVPATLAWAVGEEAGLHENIIVEDPERTVDNTLTVLAAYDAGGRLLGTLMNWACHPTVMGQANTLVTSDFAGAYYRILGEELGGVHLYANGTIGAMIQPVNRWSPPGAWHEVDAVGRRLANDVLALLPVTEPIRAPSIHAFATGAAPVRLENPLFPLAVSLGLIVRDLPALGEETPVPLTIFSVGPVAFGTLPGEYVCDYSPPLRGILGGDAQILVGLAMDWIGYALTPRQTGMDAYAYERALCAGPGAGDALITAYRALREPWEPVERVPFPQAVQEVPDARRAIPEE